MTYIFTPESIKENERIRSDALSFTIELLEDLVTLTPV